MSTGRFTAVLLLLASTAAAQVPWDSWEPRPGTLPRSGHENDIIAVGLGMTSTALVAANLAIRGDGARALAGFGAVMGAVSVGAGAHMQHTRAAHAALAWSAIGLGVASATTGAVKWVRGGRTRETAIELSPGMTPPTAQSSAMMGFRATLRF